MTMKAGRALAFGLSLVACGGRRCWLGVSTPRRRRRRAPRQKRRRLLIRNAMVIYGSARPPYGPVDIVVEDGLISYISVSSPTTLTRRRR